MPAPTETRWRRRRAVRLGAAMFALGSVLVALAARSTTPASTRSVLAASGNGLLLVAAASWLAAIAMSRSRR